MKPPNGDRIQEIFHKALMLPPSERGAFVATACADDPAVAHEIGQLLKTHDSPVAILESPVIRLDFVPDNLVGTPIDGRYCVDSKLGESAMSQVYLARDLRLQEQAVVVKVLSRALVQDADARRRFKKEVEALLRIQHPNVVRVLDTGELADSRPYIVTSYIEGEALRAQIPSGGMNLERAASMLKQIGAALDHVHEQKIFHRDLKPENVIVRRGADSVVLIDFGIAKVRDSLVAPSTVDGVSAGTLLYMSPEQLNDQPITAESDIYSMAVIAYEMVTGHRPFNASTPSQLADMQRAGVRVKPGDLRPNLPRRAAEIIVRGLSFKPNHRYQKAGQFCNELAMALKNEAEGHRRVAPSKQRFAIAGVLLLLLSVAGLFVYSRCGPKPIVPPKRSFSYWLMVQKMRDGKEYQDPFKSNDDAVFESGDKFRLNVKSPAPGYLYVINEGPPQSGNTSFAILYPQRSINDGSATIGADQTVELDWIIFRGPPGAENLWIVWSVSPVSELDAAKTEAFKQPNGGLTDQIQVTVKEYLKAKQAEINARTTRYKASQQATVRAPGDLLVALAEIKHR